jgi:hypothetical protein
MAEVVSDYIDGAVAAIVVLLLILLVGAVFECLRPEDKAPTAFCAVIVLLGLVVASSGLIAKSTYLRYEFLNTSDYPERHILRIRTAPTQFQITENLVLAFDGLQEYASELTAMFRIFGTGPTLSIAQPGSYLPVKVNLGCFVEVEIGVTRLVVIILDESANDMTVGVGVAVLDNPIEGMSAHASCN